MRTITVLIGMVFIFLACSKSADYPEAPSDGSRVIIDINNLREEVPVFYTFKHDGRNIDYIVLKTGNDIRSYFDACTNCYRQKKGFRHEDGNFVCNLCGVGHSLHSLEEGEGSCYPIKLEGRLNGDIYEIDKDRLSEGAAYF